MSPPPVTGKPLKLYLSVTEHAVNGLIAQELEGEERPVSYLSRVMKEAEKREQGRNREEGHIVFFNDKEASLSNEIPEKEDWRGPILEQLKQKLFNKAIRDYREVKGSLYRRSSEGLLMKCITEEQGTLPPTPQDAEKLRKKAQRYFLQGGELFKESLTGGILRCLGKEEQEKVMGEVHGGVCGRHQGGMSLWAELIRMGYFWPSMKEDTMDLLEYASQCSKAH
ncbi:hypothetical protein SESBI_26529 [Sesbania bispinosa]|nr:hypothetical protein SESBI_26529 [Sesbania bispinosa]